MASKGRTSSPPIPNRGLASQLGQNIQQQQVAPQQAGSKGGKGGGQSNIPSPQQPAPQQRSPKGASQPQPVGGFADQAQRNVLAQRGIQGGGTPQAAVSNQQQQGSPKGSSGGFRSQAPVKQGKGTR